MALYQLQISLLVSDDTLQHFSQLKNSSYQQNETLSGKRAAIYYCVYI